jgi:hypothetical protein
MDAATLIPFAVGAVPGVVAFLWAAHGWRCEWRVGNVLDRQRHELGTMWVKAATACATLEDRLAERNLELARCSAELQRVRQASRRNSRNARAEGERQHQRVIARAAEMAPERWAAPWRVS